jgi:formate dehydrogenase subunit beta
MPTLITDLDQVNGADPLSPAFPMNSAKILSRLTRRPSGSKVAAVMRPCEIRAFIELVKLKQGRMEDIVMIGLDCLGAFENRAFFDWADGDSDEATKRFYTHVLSEKEGPVDGVDVAPACKACEFPMASGADISLGLFGMDTAKQVLVQGLTPEGEALMGKLGLRKIEEPPSRKKSLDRLISDRIAYRDNMFTKTREAAGDLEKLTAYLANCINCYNCRVACPVCYCRECVFVTDVFDHEPQQYLRWAERKGAVKIPTDTSLYHITRMAHMSTACVGCGQCSNACPNDIPLMELFRTTAHQTQQAFEYEAGRSIDEKPPLTEFREDEFQDVVDFRN